MGDGNGIFAKGTLIALLTPEGARPGTLFCADPGDRDINCVNELRRSIPIEQNDRHTTSAGGLRRTNTTKKRVS